MNYGINLGQWNSVFAVPSGVVDEHIKFAGATQLKVLLYLLRHSGSEFSTEELSFAIGQNASDTLDAINYWIDAGVLSGGSKSENGGDIQQSTSSNASQQPEKPEQPTGQAMGTAEIKNALTRDDSARAKVVKSKEKIRYSFDECMKFVAEDENVSNMLNAVEATLGKQLTHTEVASFVTLVKWYGLPCTVVPVMVQYCKSIGKVNTSYIEATGIGWASEEIDNFDKAERKVAAMTSRRNAWNTVRSALEIPERKATENEIKFCDLWINSQHIDIELIRHAYDKCINKNGKISFNYINGILKRYFEKGITDLKSALKLDEEERASRDSRKKDGSSSVDSRTGGGASDGRYAPTYDTSEIEAILDAEWMSEGVGNDEEYNYDDD